MHRSIPLAVALGAALTVSACGSSSSSSSATSSPTTAVAPGTTTGSGTGTGSTAVQTGNPTAATTLNESGSSLLFPYLQELVSPLTAKYSNVTLAPAAGGSGKGISDAIAGTTQMGGSDAYLAPAQASANPGLMNIPIVVSSQSVDYNLPNGPKNLKLSGKVLSDIYQGKVTKWNDPEIAQLNSGATLPATTIVPVRRVDSSGDTFLFTSFLSATDPAWQSGPGEGTTVTWPAAPGELTANGNPGMVQTCKATPGCVAYVGISAQSSATAAGLGQAMLQNKAGQYVLPTSDNVNSAVANSTSNVPANLAASLIYASGATSYPIVNFEYIIVKAQQSSADTALAIRDFLTYAIDPNGGGQQQYLSKESFEALPSSVLPKVNAAIAKITG